MNESHNIYGEPILWRDTMRSPRLAIFDARLIFFCFLPVLHFRVWTVTLLVFGVLTFWGIERAGLRFPSALRALRSRLAGATRPARPRAQYRSEISYAFEGHPLLPDRVWSPVKRPAPAKEKQVKTTKAKAKKQSAAKSKGSPVLAE